MQLQWISVALLALSAPLAATARADVGTRQLLTESYGKVKYGGGKREGGVVVVSESRLSVPSGNSAKAEAKQYFPDFFKGDYDYDEDEAPAPPMKKKAAPKKKATVPKKKKAKSSQKNKKKPMKKKKSKGSKGKKSKGKKPSSKKRSKKASKKPTKKKASKKSKSKKRPSKKSGSSGGGSGGGGGKWVVCVPKGKTIRFGGAFKFRGKPDGIKVSSSGKCQLEEWAGGFDGFWSVNAADNHEKELAEATKQMLRTGNAGATEFLKEMMRRAKPVDLDHPKDEGRADNGGRMANIRKASKVCTSLITVKNC